MLAIPQYEDRCQSRAAAWLSGLSFPTDDVWCVSCGDERPDEKMHKRYADGAYVCCPHCRGDHVLRMWRWRRQRRLEARLLADGTVATRKEAFQLASELVKAVHDGEV